MRGLLLALAVAVALVPGAAAARPHVRHHVRHHAEHAAGYGPRPGAWCGWQMRIWQGERDPSLNVARNWARWGRAGSPGVGAVVVWPHHVGRIVGGQDTSGAWLIESGNDNHAIRTRYRSIARAIAIRWR